MGEGERAAQYSQVARMAAAAAEANFLENGNLDRLARRRISEV